MAVVVGYDRHPASRAALMFAGDLAGALNVSVHVVHALDLSDSPIAGATKTENSVETRQKHAGDILDAAGVPWTFHVLDRDPPTALLAIADEWAASMIVIGRPEHGVGAALGHVLTGATARSLLRRSRRPVVIVPGIEEP
ncbi:universal stress protein [Mycobacterium sp. pUA109]|uniref:universal stress protein n=1 Tax=Mycobacterium sp. pUA109 TaxID=3238982 RepID=UPI00351AE3F9